MATKEKSSPLLYAVVFILIILALVLRIFAGPGDKPYNLPLLILRIVIQLFVVAGMIFIILEERRKKRVTVLPSVQQELSLHATLPPTTDLVEKYTQEVRALLQDLKDKNGSYHNAFNRLKKVQEELQNLARSEHPPELETEESRDLLWLVKELSDAASSESMIRSLAEPVLEIIDTYLGRMQGSPAWKKIETIKGPFEEFEIHTCGGCGRHLPHGWTQDFSLLDSVFCDSCGALVLYNAWDPLLKDLLTIPDLGVREKRAGEMDVLIPQCPCGGTLVYAPVAGGACPICGSSTLKDHTISRYTYFQDHRFYFFDNLQRSQQHQS